MNGTFISLFLLVLQFIFMGIGLSGKYRLSPMHTTWPDWAVLSCMAGQFVNAIILLIK